ncbi:MAG: ABC transporter permease [Clostridiales bacterium]|jgi:putative ABC transport system permease protein|nr:ABC transporter permease [Clostridiales bacterium]
MSRAYITEMFREIRKSLLRYLSIIAIVVLGVAFYSGIRATSPDMKKTAEQYFRNTNLYDFMLLSTTGFSDDDVAAIKSENIKNIMPSYSLDYLLKNNNDSICLKVSSLPYGDSPLNKLTITEGQYPQAEDECLINSRSADEYKIKTGDTIELVNADNNGKLENTSFKVSGLANSPCFISRDYGTTSIGNGQVNGIIWVDKANFRLTYYTEIYVEADKTVSPFNSDYKDSLTSLSDSLVTLGAERCQNLYNKMLAAEQDGAEIPKWYVLGLDSNYGVENYRQDSDKVAAIGVVFPLIFFLVAALVCLTAMTRMVEEDRTQIGTLKALGYKNSVILTKYIFYALSATISGSVIGAILGLNILPRVIFSAYRILYSLPSIVVSFNASNTITAAILAIVSTGAATLGICIKELHSSPADLMRPKAPTNGKRIFLEHIPFIWNHMGFNKKVTARNLFRYKKRLFMTLIGIAGCTGLLITGFGLRDSISQIVHNQYGIIRIYDMELSLKTSITDSDRENLENLIKNNSEIKEYINIRQQSIDVENDGNSKSAYLDVFESGTDISDYINLRTRVGKKQLQLDDNGILITEKLANSLNIKKGSEINITDAENNDIKVKVEGICENYAFHYIYMSSDLYEKLYGSKAQFNEMYLNVINSSADKNAIASSLLGTNFVNSVTITDVISKNFADMVNKLVFVVLVLIISALALEFVVLFNLTSINIEERKREIATLKVLGFYDRESAAYIYRENIVLSLIGILLGFGFGSILHQYIIVTVEVDIVMFARNITWQSFLYAALLTLAFSLLVNLWMSYYIKRISMVESLKSSE